MDPLFILDFDGVLFDTQWEVYEICQHLSSLDSSLRNDVSCEEFEVYRASLAEAWQLRKLYISGGGVKTKADAEDLDFAHSFFSARQSLQNSPSILNHIKPYRFFSSIKPLIEKRPQNFKILSSRDTSSIQIILERQSITQLEIAGSEIVSSYGNKLATAKAKGWLAPDIFSLYVDDMHSYVSDFFGQADLVVHAGWGYGEPSSKSFSDEMLSRLIWSLLGSSR